MEGELAGFREAAIVVEELISVEEGRAGIKLSEENLPAYDGLDALPTYSHEDGAVANGFLGNGFRYTPPSPREQ